MKKILDALGNAVQGLLSTSTLRSVLIITAITCIFLLMYVNNTVDGSSNLLGTFGCPLKDTDQIQDFLGICDFVEDKHEWIGLIAVVSILMVAVGIVQWFWSTVMLPVLRPSDNPKPVQDNKP